MMANASDTKFKKYLEAKKFLDSLLRTSLIHIDDVLCKIEAAELKGPTYIIATRLMSRKQLIQHYQKIEHNYKSNYLPYVMKKQRRHRLRIPSVSYDNDILPKNYKDIIAHAYSLGYVENMI